MSEVIYKRHNDNSTVNGIYVNVGVGQVIGVTVHISKTRRNPER